MSDARPAPDVTGPAVPPDEATSRWEDLIDVYIAPAELYRRRARDRVAPPLVMLLLAAVALYLVLLPANRLIIAATAADDPQAAAFLEQYGTLMQLFGVVTVPIWMLGAVAFAALLIWLLLRAASRALAFDRALLIATYAGFVLLLGQVASAVLVLLQTDGAIDVTRDLSLGPLRFVPLEANSPAEPLLRRFEPFAIWQAVLWGIGVRHVAGIAAGRAALIAAVAWLLYALPTFLFALVRPLPGG